MIRALWVALCAMVAWGAPAPSELPLQKDFSMRLCVLVLSTNSDASEMPKNILNAFGTPAEVVKLIDTTSGAPVLTDPSANFLNNLKDSQGNPQYSGLVLTSPDLSYTAVNGSMVSALTSEQWDKLNGFSADFGVRRVVFSSSHTADAALQAPADIIAGSGRDAILTFSNDTSIQGMLGNVKQGAVFRIGRVNEHVSTSYWYFPCVLGEADSSHLQPFMYLDLADCPSQLDGASQTADAQQPCGNENWIVGFTRTADGREEMHFTITQSPFGHFPWVVGNVWLQWVTRGLFVGQRRILLSTQVDDMFLSTGLYNTELLRPASDGNEPNYRMSSHDLELTLQHQERVNERLPAGSNYVVEYAFNGLGWWNFGNQTFSVNKVFTKLRDKFFWVTHTWSHIDLTCNQSDCSQSVAYHLAYEDLKANQDFARETLFGDVPEDQLETWPTYSIGSIVTPKISGLDNPEAIQAMHDLNITVAVGDNSRQELIPPNLYHAHYTATNDTSDKPMFVIPRNAVRIYFDTSLPDQVASQLNSMFGPSCTSCNPSGFRYGRNLDFDDILLLEGFENARSLLSFRWDPFMFHQSNLRFFEKDGQTVSLHTQWVDSVLDYMMNYTSFPILTYKMGDLSVQYEKRMERDGCGISAALVYKDGLPAKIVVDAVGNCTAKITSTPEFVYAMVGEGTEEIYGLDRTRDITMAGNKVVLSLEERSTREAPISSAIALDNATVTASATATMDPSDIMPDDDNITMTNTTIVNTQPTTMDGFKEYVEGTMVELAQALEISLKQDETKFVDAMVNHWRSTPCIPAGDTPSVNADVARARLDRFRLPTDVAKLQAADSFPRRALYRVQSVVELLKLSLVNVPEEQHAEGLELLRIQSDTISREAAANGVLIIDEKIALLQRELGAYLAKLPCS